MTKKKNEYYIEPKVFIPELKAWKEARALDPSVQWSDSLCKKFMKIIEGLSHHKSFSGYSYIDEMKDEALFHIMKYGHNYNPDKLDDKGRPYNPFSYYNRIAWQAFVSIINKEKHQQMIKGEYLRKNYTLDSELFLDGAEDHTQALDMMAKMYDVKSKETEDK